MKKLLLTLAMAASLSACASGISDTTEPANCYVYNVTLKGCSTRAELFRVNKTGQCFLVVFPASYTQTGGTEMGIAIAQVSNSACE